MCIIISKCYIRYWSHIPLLALCCIHNSLNIQLQVHLTIRNYAIKGNSLPCTALSGRNFAHTCYSISSQDLPCYQPPPTVRPSLRLSARNERGVRVIKSKDLSHQFSITSPGELVGITLTATRNDVTIVTQRSIMSRTEDGIQDVHPKQK